MEDLEGGLLEYETAGEFLADIKKEFGKEDEEGVKVVELKRLEQGRRIIEEFVQEFRRAAKESGYEERPLVEKFKWDMNEMIYQRCYKFKTLELVKKVNLVLGLTQENLIENSIQDCLPYIQIPNGSCKLFLAYPKWPCVCLKVNMYITYCMISSLPECSMSFPALCDL